MGSWFSKPDDTIDESEKREIEFQKAMETLKQQEETLYAAAQEAEVKKKETLEQSAARQKEIAATRMKEMEDTIVRAQELKDARRLLNIQASQLLCALYYNYQFGEIDEDPDGEWGGNVETVIDKCLNVETFWLLCKIPQLLPLLWPTGSDCDKFHEYELDEKGEPIVSSHKIAINTNIETYVFSTLTNYLSSVCQANCKKYSDFNEDRNTELGKKCKKYLTEVETMLSDDEWVKRTQELIKDDDKMNWKCFAARSGKGITKNKIRLLPSIFPKICPKYELYESLLMVTNTVINHYGDIRTETGIRVNANSKEKHTNGGQCFELNSTWIDNVYKKALDTTTIWDGETYVSVNSLLINIKDITGKEKDEEWMKSTKLHDKTHVYGQLADGTGGYLKYVNPTQKYTQQFINDIDNVEVAFQMPRLSAAINSKFTTDFLFNIFTSLTTNKDYTFYNVYGTNNKDILTSMDYLYIVPSGLEQIDAVSPICRYIFEVMIQYSCQWYITVPIDNTMSMMKITANMMTYKDGKDKSFLPQYTWTEVASLQQSTNNQTLDQEASQEQKVVQESADQKASQEQISEEKVVATSQDQETGREQATKQIQETKQESFISQYMRLFSGRRGNMHRERFIERYNTVAYRFDSPEPMDYSIK